MDQLVEKQHIVCTPGICGGKPRIAGTRIRVQDIYAWHELGGLSPDEMLVHYPHLSLADIHAALAYYFDHQEEIRRHIREDEEFVAALKAKTGPGPLERKLKGMDSRRAEDSY